MNLELLRNYVDEIEATPLGALMDKASPRRARGAQTQPRAPGTDGRRRTAALHRRGRRSAGRDQVRRPGARRGRRRRSHLRRQSQYQFHQHLFRRMPVLRLQAPALGVRRLRSFRRNDPQQGRRRGRARRNRDLHAGRHQPRDAADFKYRDLLDAIKARLSRDSHPRVLADGDHVRRAARADGLPGVYRDARARPGSDRFPAPRRKSSTTACARS